MRDESNYLREETNYIHYAHRTGSSLVESSKMNERRVLARAAFEKRSRADEALRQWEEFDAVQSAKSNLFGFEDQRSKIQREACELFETLGQRILSFANQQPELHGQLDKLEDPIVRLPIVTINNKPAMMLLSTGGDETISLVSPGHEPTLSDAWRILDSLSVEEWVSLPDNPTMLANLKEAIVRLPGFHMTRRAHDGTISFINGGLDTVILDNDPLFGQALKEVEALALRYFENQGKVTPVTLHEQRRQLAEERAFKSRNIGRRILDYFQIKNRPL